MEIWLNLSNIIPKTKTKISVAVHLANQHYKICFRRGNGKEVICYIPCTSISGLGGELSTTSAETSTPTAQVS